MRAGLSHELTAAVVAIAQAAQCRLSRLSPRHTSDLIGIVIGVDRLYLIGQRRGG